MKKIICLLFLLVATGMACAQTQQGIVKTRGRMVNGQLKPGTKLSSATVTLSIGNPVVSGQNGAFSFNVPSGKSYSLVMAKKPGYTLADPDCTRRSFKYSAGNPFYVVLEDENQRQADINAATRKVRKTLNAQLEKCEEEIEALKAQNRLTEKEYQERLQQLYDNQSKSEQLVKEMAERYASTDYDQLDEFNQQVQMYIEEGELQKADSMIRSKGDMAQRVAEYHDVVAANQKTRQQLEQSEAGAAKAYEDLSQDLLRQSEIFLQAYQQDSALYCLKMRADLDTTNVTAVLHYAVLCYKQNSFIESEKYHLICLRAISQTDDLVTLSHIKRNIGNLYDELKDIERAGYYYKSSLHDAEELYSKDAESYRSILAQSQYAIGGYYKNILDFSSSEKYLKLAIDNYETALRKDSTLELILLSRMENELAIVYSLSKQYDKAEEYFIQSLQNLEKLYHSNPNAVADEYALSLSNVALFYLEKKDLLNSEKYFLMALEKREVLYEKNPDANRARLANLLNSLGYLYKMKEDLPKSEQFLLRSLHLREELSKDYSSAYRLSISNTQNSLGGLYHKMKNYEKSEQYYLLALENRQKLYDQYPQIYVAHLAATLQLTAYMYIDAGQYEKAVDFVNKGLLLKPNNTGLHHLLGEILLMQGKNDEALAMWKKVLELNPEFLKDNPDGTNLSNGLKKLGLIE